MISVESYVNKKFDVLYSLYTYYDALCSCATSYNPHYCLKPDGNIIVIHIVPVNIVYSERIIEEVCERNQIMIADYCNDMILLYATYTSILLLLLLLLYYRVPISTGASRRVRLGRNTSRAFIVQYTHPNNCKSTVTTVIIGKI